MKTYYQTRYALTSGIAEVEGEEGGHGYIQHGKHGFDKLGKDIFETMEEAQADQRKRALKAIASSEKKIAKLRKMLEVSNA